MFNREAAHAKARALVSKMTLEEKMSQLVYGAPAIERLGVPAYNWWNEGLHGVARAGVATSFPQAIALAAMFDREELKSVGRPRWKAVQSITSSPNMTIGISTRVLPSFPRISTSSATRAGAEATKPSEKTPTSPPSSAKHSSSACRARARQ